MTFSCSPFTWFSRVCGCTTVPEDNNTTQNDGGESNSANIPDAQDLEYKAPVINSTLPNTGATKDEICQKGSGKHQNETEPDSKTAIDDAKCGNTDSSHTGVSTEGHFSSGGGGGGGGGD